MASSELEVEPDLKKAPPHVEGELLRQNTKAIFGQKGWRKFFFIVIRDKLQYYDKRDESKQNKEPIAFIRMSQVTSITEVVFSGVPKKHHLNCGFTVEAFHPVTQQQVTLNLLAETPEDMRYWVHALRYIKAYWSKMMIRETVLSEEQERRILEKILSGDLSGGDDAGEVIPGSYSLDEDPGGLLASTEEPAGATCPMGSALSLYFADGAKVKVHLSPTDTTSDLLEKEEVKHYLTSSAARVWLVDSQGNDMIFGPQDNPGLFPGKAHKLYVLDHTRYVLPVFLNKKDFECIIVGKSITASQVIEHHDVSVALDLNGVTNRGLFLKSDSEEMMFTGTECPCDVLFDMDENNNLVRQPVGKLVVHNKSLGGGRGNTTLFLKRKQRTTFYKPSRYTDQKKMMEQISEAEEAQSKALDMLMMKKRRVPTVGFPIGEEPVSESEVDIDGNHFVMVDKAKDLNSDPSETERGHTHQKDERGLEDPVVVGGSLPARMMGGSSPALSDQRHRASAMSEVGKRGSSMKLVGSSPTMSPSSSPRKARSRSKSPGRRLPEAPPLGLQDPSSQSPSQPRRDSGNSASSENSTPNHTSSSLSPKNTPSLHRRNATRGGSISSSKRGSYKQSDSDSTRSGSGSGSIKSHSDSVRSNSGSGRPTADTEKELKSTSTPPPPLSVFKPGKGPTIRLTNNPVAGSSPTTGGGATSPTGPSRGLKHQRSRATSIRETFMESLSFSDSRSSGFGYAPSSTSPAPSALPPEPLHKRQQRPLQEAAATPTAKDTPTKQETTSKADAALTPPTNTKSHDTATPPDSPVTLRPMVIDFSKLRVAPANPGPEGRGKERGEGEEEREEANQPDGKPLPIIIPSPHLLKVVLLQSSEASEITAETQPMDFISLSGVTLVNTRGVWSLQEGCNYHDDLPFACDDHTETFRLTGGIRAVFNHTHKRWHVLPPSHAGPTPLNGSLTSSMASVQGETPSSLTGSTERAQDSMEGSGDTRQAVISPPPNNNLYVSKKVVVTEVGSAFHDIMNLFGQTRDAAEKKKIGSDMTNPKMGHMIRGRFCSAVAKLLLDGLRPYRLQGIVQDNIWDVTLAFCSAAQSDPTCSLVTPAMDKQVFQPINALKAQLRDNNVKFRTFLCLAMSKGMLIGWLEALPKQRSVLKKYYLPSSFLWLVSEGTPYQQLYQEMLLTLEPMAYLPFDLSIDFELRQAPHAAPGGVAGGAASSQLQPPTTGGVANGEGGLKGSLTPIHSPRMLSPAPESNSPPQSALRPNVVIKTHAATGQRSAAGNVISAVWETSPMPSPTGRSPSPAPPSYSTHGSDETDQGRGGAEETKMQSPPRESKVQGSRGQESRTTATPQGGNFKKFGGSLLKKLSDQFQQLNTGGAITGAPHEAPKARTSQAPQPRPKPPPSISEARQVEALYSNICEDNDELSFRKGDLLMVKEQINSEWLICSLGTRTGIVPMNYIKPVA